MPSRPRRYRLCWCSGANSLHAPGFLACTSAEEMTVDIGSLTLIGLRLSVWQQRRDPGSRIPSAQINSRIIPGRFSSTTLRVSNFDGILHAFFYKLRCAVGGKVRRMTVTRVSGPGFLAKETCVSGRAFRGRPARSKVGKASGCEVGCTESSDCWHMCCLQHFAAC